MFNNNLCSLVCMGRDLINPVVARWLDGKCQRLLATALKVQHCWTLKTTVGDCWRQSPTCAGGSRQLNYKHTRDCRRLSPSRATVGDWSINQALDVASVRDQIHCIRWGQTSIFYAATSLLNCYKKACMGYILHGLIWTKFVSLRSMYAQFGIYM